MTEGRLESLLAVQRDRTRRWTATTVATTVGLALATVHWSGFLAGGALVGLAQPGLRPALAGGLGFGVLSLVVFLTQLGAVGSLGSTLGMGSLLGISLAVPVVGGLLGSTVRGLLPSAR